ncbi:MAG: 3-oxoacyl-ACP synthase III family protein [Odoribacter splanchnicus]
MLSVFTHKKISSIVSVLPSDEVDFKDEIHNYSFPESQNLRLAKVMGFKKRRISRLGETVSDYANYGIQHLLDEGIIKEEEIGAIFVVTTTADHFIPPVSNIIHGHFGFDQDVICVDISQGCCGYVIGVQQAFMSLSCLGDKKVLLVTGDLLTHRISTRDRGSRPITGDAVAISVIENTKEENTLYCSLKNDGKAAFSVYIPAGGMRMPITEETSIEKEDVNGNFRSLNHLVMNGDLVFNFIINEVPNMIEELLNFAGEKKENIEYFLCHQSSKFTLQKLADRLEVPRKIMPNDIVEMYGNSSSATIPVTICHYFNQLFAEKDFLKVILAGFGIGLTWGGILCDLTKLDYCKMIDFPHK